MTQDRKIIHFLSFTWILIFLLLLIPASTLFGDTCSLKLQIINQKFSGITITEEVATVFGQQVKYTLIDDPYHRQVRAEDLFLVSNALYWGIDPTAHSYVIAGDSRVDGEVYWGLAGHNDRSTLLNTGIIIRIPLSSQQNAHADKVLKNHFRFRSINCMGFACKVVMGGFGFRFGDLKFPVSFKATSVLRRLISSGLLNEKGEIVPIEIYVRSSGTLEYTMELIKKRENDIAIVMMTKALLLGSGVGTIGLSCFVITRFAQEDKLRYLEIPCGWMRTKRSSENNFNPEAATR